MSPKRTSTLKTVQRTKDDFTRVHGIGPVTEKHLHVEGIHTYSQLAKLSAKAIHSLVPNFSENQINNQNWIGQARKLAHSRKKQDHKKRNDTSITCQHYENFTLEFLLDDKNKIRRVRAIHIQSGDKDTWSHWDTERLIAFLSWHTGAHIPHGKPAALASHTPANVTSSTTEPAQQLAIPPHSPSLPSRLVSVENVTPEMIPQAPTVSPIQIHLLEWKTLLARTDQPICSLPHGNPFDVKLKLDISKTSLSRCAHLGFTGMLYAKKLGGGSRQIIGEMQGIVPYSPVIDLTINNATLTQGIYRLETLIRLTPTGAASFPAEVDTSFQGGLLQVY